MRKSTIAEVSKNKRNLRIEKIGYGTYRISCTYRNKKISTVTHDSASVDLYNSGIEERKNNQNCMALGYNSLVWQIIRANRPI